MALLFLALFCPTVLSAQCLAPTSLLATSPTTSGATFDWTENEGATHWDIEIQPDGTAMTGTPTFSGITKPYTWAGGTQAKKYNYQVRSQCTSGGTSPWAGPKAFVTAMDNAGPICVTLSIPDGGCFSSGDALELPISVSGAPGTSLGSDVYIDRVEVIIQHGYTGEVELELLSPTGAALLLSSNNGFGANYGNPGACPSQPTVFAPWATTSITAGDSPFIGNYLPEGSFSTLNGLNPNGTWTLRVCDFFPSFAGNLKYVRIYFTECPKPSDLTASNVTVNGATFDWTENGTATAWDLEFQPVGTNPTGTPTVIGVTKPYTWTGGNQATRYQAWVRSNCGGSSSDWVGPVSFLTAMNNASPSCVTLSIPDGGCFSSGDALELPISVSGAPGTSLGSDVYIDRVEVIIQHGYTGEVELELLSPTGAALLLSSNNGFGANYGNPGACPSQPTVFAPWATTSITAGDSPFIGNYLPQSSFSTLNGENPNGTWTLRICDLFPSFAGNLKYVRIYFTACPRPAALTASDPATNGATFNWTENGTATAWDLEFQPVGTNPTGTPTVTGVTKPYTWTGGSQATSYQAWVRSNCGGSSSAWVGPVTFQTTINNNAPACLNFGLPGQGCSNTIPITVSGAPGNTLGTDVFLDKAEIIISHTWTDELDIYLETPSGVQVELSTDNGGSGSHYGNPNSCPSQTTSFSMSAATSITTGAAPFIGSYVPEGNFSSFNGADPNGNWKLVVCDDGPFITGSLRYVKLSFSACPSPGGATATNPTGNGATINWTENGGATTWDLEFQPVGMSQTGVPTVSGTSSKPYTWTGGNPATTYQVWVRSNCGGSNSGWSAPATFSTTIDNNNPTCLNFALPPTGCSNTIPISVSGTGGNTLGSDVFLDNVQITIQHTWSDELDIYLQTPSGVEVELSTDNGSSNSDYGNPGACPNQTTNFAMWATTPITAGAAPFIGNYIPEGNFASFNGANPNGNWTLRVCDDQSSMAGSLKYVKLNFTTCPRPTSVTTSSPTVNGATINWTENGSATTWDLEIQPVGTGQTGIPTVTGTSSKPYTWTGGVGATGYQVWVRSSCGGSTSGWSTAGSFFTLINNAAPTCFEFYLPPEGNSNTIPIVVNGAPGNTLGSDVFLDKVEIIMYHTWTNELDVYLQTPSGVEVELSTDNDEYGYGDYFDCPTSTTAFSMSATTPITAGTPPFIGTYIPEGNFADFNGQNPNGNWTLRVFDDAGGGVGILGFVKLTFATALPVSLVEFVAKLTEAQQVVLDWATESEQNSEWFAVERSADGVNFEEIERVQAAGNSSDERRYSVLDERPLPGTSYYRLRQMDFDGKFEFSPVRSVKIQGRSPDDLKVYPNPAHGSFFVETLGMEGVISLVSLDGKQVLTQAFFLDENTTKVETANLPPGLYWLRLKTLTDLFTTKIVVE